MWLLRDQGQVGIATSQPIDDINTSYAASSLPAAYFGNLADSVGGTIFGSWFAGVTNVLTDCLTLDELALYNSALSSSRITAHYVAGASGPSAAFSINDILYDSVNTRFLLIGQSSNAGLTTTTYTPAVYSAPTSLVTQTLITNLVATAGDNWEIVGVGQSGTDIAVLMNDLTNNVVRIAVSTNSGTTWSYPTVSWPATVALAFCFDGTRFLATFEGYSSESTNLTSWTTSGGGSGLSSNVYLRELYPNGSGKTAAVVSLSGGGNAGTAVTSDGLTWTLSPVTKASASEVSFSDSGTQIPASDVQDALEYVSNAWQVIKNQVFGD